MGRRERHLVGLDLGTSKVAAIVGEVMSSGEVEIIGLGVAESHGIRRGAVVNLEAAVESIRKAVEEAELTAGIEIDNAYVALSGTHVKGFNSRGVVAVAGNRKTNWPLARSIFGGTARASATSPSMIGRSQSA